MSLSERDKEIVKGYIDRGEALPARYKLLLFEDAPEVELIWQGKTSEVTTAVLPFQSIEHIDEPRSDEMRNKTLPLFAADAQSGRQSGGWTNKLIWGDNKLVLSSLKNGPLRREIEAAGGLKLIYIDPPFDVGDDFSFSVEVGGGEAVTKQPSLLEELAYRDTWGRGSDSYLSMLHERANLLRDLLAEDGSIYVHVGWQVSGAVRMVLSEVFGTENLLNEIAWQRTGAHNDANRYGIIHDTLYLYSKSKTWTFNTVHTPYELSYIEERFKSVEEGTGRRYWLNTMTAAGQGPSRSFNGVLRAPPKGTHWRYSQERIDEGVVSGKIVFTDSGMPYLKQYLDESPGRPAQSLWTDLIPTKSGVERLDYATQKPESLLDRVLRSSSNEGDLVADFFCGSGTSMAVAEQLGRKWIGCDLGRFAIHTSRKRLIGVQRQLKAEGKPYRAFEILNLGKYERQYFVGIDPNLPEEQRRAQSIQREEHYVSLILSAYRAERVFQTPPFHGRQGATMVLVGPVDAPVTLSQINDVVAACREKHIARADVLGFEFEMGLTPAVQDEARQKGVSLSLKYIPKDVFDRRAIEKGQVQFYDVAYMEVLPKVIGRSVTVALKDFGVFYRQDDGDAVATALKPGGSKVTVRNGQVVKLTKDKAGIVSEEVLTKKWQDWIDYWAVDFNYASKKEIITVTENSVERELWTGSYIFENEWQSFRTRKDRSLDETSVSHEYGDKGKRKIAVKVIDIFGNDTTKVVEVSV